MRITDAPGGFASRVVQPGERLEWMQRVSGGSPVDMSQAPAKLQVVSLPQHLRDQTAQADVLYQLQAPSLVEHFQTRHPKSLAAKVVLVTSLPHKTGRSPQRHQKQQDDNCLLRSAQGG